MHVSVDARRPYPQGTYAGSRNPPRTIEWQHTLSNGAIMRGIHEQSASTHTQVHTRSRLAARSYPSALVYASQGRINPGPRPPVLPDTIPLKMQWHGTPVEPRSPSFRTRPMTAKKPGSMHVGHGDRPSRYPRCARLDCAYICEYTSGGTKSLATRCDRRKVTVLEWRGARGLRAAERDCRRKPGARDGRRAETHRRACSCTLCRQR